MMDGFVYIDRLSPYLVQTRLWGQVVGVRWYGLTYVFGFLLTFLYFRRAVRSGAVPGLGPGTLEQLTGAIAVGVVLGGRLGFVAQHPHELLADPLFAVRIWEGGMAFFGGLVGVLLAILWVVRRHGLSFLALTDVAVFPAALGLGLGRLANFANQELIGRPTGGRWGVVFPTVDDLPRHPSQLYEAASHFLLFAALVCVQRLCPGQDAERRGRLSFLFLALYGLLRFLTDFFRDDDVFWGPFSDGQWVSLLVGLVGGGLLTHSMLLRRKAVKA